MDNDESKEKEIDGILVSGPILPERFEDYRQVVQNQGDILVCFDSEYKMVLVNQQYYKIFGGTEETVIGKSILALIHPEDMDEMLEGLKKVFLSPHYNYQEHRVQTSTGVKWFGWSYRAILDNSDAVVEIVAVGRDLTNFKNKEVEMLKYGSHLEKVVRERTKSLLLANQKLKMEISERVHFERALLDSHKQYNLILSGISDIVVLLSVENKDEFRVVNISDSYCKEMNLSREKVLNRKLGENYLDKATEKQIIQAAMNVLEGFPHEKIVVVTNKGKYFDIKIFPAYDDLGKCSHLIVVGRDVTEKRKMEEHHQKIEKLESIGLLAGGIAHDFNNILTAIIGNVSLVKVKIGKFTCDETITGLISQIEKASQQAKDLTQQLLTFAKGGNPILKTTSVADLVKESSEFALRGSNVKCDYIIPDDLWPSMIDQSQFNQVVNNLVINADHAMRGGGTIRIHAENIIIDKKSTLPLAPGRYIKLAIQDFGVGIPKKEINKIFDPYFTTKEMGSGLGLTTTYSIIRRHGGYITVDSEIGVGTTFNIILPASEDKPVKKTRKKANTGAQSGKGKILVMDDEKMVRYVLSEMLTHLGYEVSTAKDGQEAIGYYCSAKQKGTPFDAVIMDLTIPGGMGGKDTIKKLLEVDPSVKAIVSSGYSNDPVMANYKKYGFHAVVHKPYGMEELGETLRNVVFQAGKGSKAS